MSKRIPFYKPTKFSGAINESVNLFIDKYNKANRINGWSSDQKVLFLGIYLYGTAATFLDNFENKNPTTTWTDLENALRLDFEPIAEKYMLKTMLQKRKQLPNESIPSYINDVQHLCNKIDPMISQSDIVYTIMKGLRPEITKYIGVLDNNNLEDLKRNINKYESIEFMINKEITQSPNEITKERINTINNDNTKQLEKLSSKMSSLESILNDLCSHQIYNNNYVNNSNINQYRNNNQYTKRLAHNYLHQNEFNISQINSNFEDNQQNIIHNNYHNYYQPNYDVNKQEKYSDNYLTPHNNDNKIPKNHKIEYSHQFKHCYKFNQNTTECKKKLTRNLRNKKCHIANDCYLKNNDLKTNQTKPTNRLNEPTGYRHNPLYRIYRI